MIIEWIVNVACGFASWVGSLTGGWEPPSWMTDAHSGLVTMLQSFAGFGVWVDWVAIGICVPTLLAVWVATVGVRLLRAIVAHIPLFGGSGA